ncbi:PREDICTED: putative F-box/LRR-repeat protein At3g18150 [Camelina sativa]|uniref:F-box/LRR-repeat protein At3g18150 n=1 Tax=Camelina sativa TaxID=90675 RepID=A0ABM0X5G7_CAMSA|nr:PREDICTED: putative F-box/LRR-repeat protein At3g18150 [Camelina sativa]
MAGGSFLIAALRARRRHRKVYRRRRKIKRGVDSISSLPEVILQHILSFIPTKLAIQTSLLSKRWRHVWCDIPSLSLDEDYVTTRNATWINKTLSLYKGAKIINFQLKFKTTLAQDITPHINRWIEFAISRNVENLCLYFGTPCSFPDFFNVNFSSVKQLRLVMFNISDIMTPVSWTSLTKLCLSGCSLFDESMAKILSGCPLLESLTLWACDRLSFLDLSKLLRLRRLEIAYNIWFTEQAQIVAPQIHYLILINRQLSSTIVDASSLTEAKLDIYFLLLMPTFKDDIIQDMALKMLEKVKNVEKLTLGGNFLHYLSLAEVRGVPFPMLKVKYLTLDTAIFRYVIPGIERVLQNSPDLKKLTVRARDYNTIPEYHLDNYLKQRGLNPDQCWRSKDGVDWKNSSWDVNSKHMVSLVELVLKNTKSLDKIILLKFKYLFPPLFHNNNNVSIVQG